MKPEALIAAVLYTVLGILLSPRFPFSDFPMYAHTAGREHGAIPVLWADGERTDPFAWTDFHGLDPDKIDLTGQPCSLGYLVDEIRWHVRNHTSETPGPVDVSFGYILLSVTAEGVHEDAPVFLTSGTARRLHDGR